jgi:hypothetical protein
VLGVKFAIGMTAFMSHLSSTLGRFGGVERGDFCFHHGLSGTFHWVFVGQKDTKVNRGYRGGTAVRVLFEEGKNVDQNAKVWLKTRDAVLNKIYD